MCNHFSPLKAFICCFLLALIIFIQSVAVSAIFVIKNEHTRADPGSEFVEVNTLAKWNVGAKWN